MQNKIRYNNSKINNNIMFIGKIITPETPFIYNEETVDENIGDLIAISNISLGPSSKQDVSLYIKIKQQQYLIARLTKQNPQKDLSLFISINQGVEFFVKGDGIIHLIGFYQPQVKIQPLDQIQLYNHNKNREMVNQQQQKLQQKKEKEEGGRQFVDNEQKIGNIQQNKNLLKCGEKIGKKQGKIQHGKKILQHSYKKNKQQQSNFKQQDELQGLHEDDYDINIKNKATKLKLLNKKQQNKYMNTKTMNPHIKIKNNEQEVKKKNKKIKKNKNFYKNKLINKQQQKNISINNNYIKQNNNKIQNIIHKKNNNQQILKKQQQNKNLQNINKINKIQHKQFQNKLNKIEQKKLQQNNFNNVNNINNFKKKKKKKKNRHKKNKSLINNQS